VKLGHVVTLASKEQMVLRAIQVLQERLARMGLREDLVSKAPQEMMDLWGTLVRQAHLVGMEHQVSMVCQGQWDTTVLLGLQETMVWTVSVDQIQKVRLANKAPLALLEKSASNQTLDLCQQMRTTPQSM